jgi:hypothetical protein
MTIKKTKQKKPQQINKQTKQNKNKQTEKNIAPPKS